RVADRLGEARKADGEADQYATERAQAEAEDDAPRLVRTCVRSSPERSIAAPVWITLSGDGRNKAGTQPVRVASSQRTRSPASARRRTRGCSRRSRARVRS